MQCTTPAHAGVVVENNRTYAIGAFLRCAAQNIPHHTPCMAREILLARLELHPIA